MKSREELICYYRGIRKGAFATSESLFGSGTGREELSEGRKDIDSSLLYDTDRLAKAAVASYLASSQLRLGGQHTWGDITLYYARFHIINAMLRLAGIALVEDGRKLLLRTDEKRQAYALVPDNDSDAKTVGFTRGSSHKVIWQMFVKNFTNWKDSEPPAIATPKLFEAPVWMRNEANYLQSEVGHFFPETDFTGLQGWTIGIARTMGEWDWLRTDANPMSDDEPPEADFHDEMMSWDLIKYVVKALVRLEGNYLLDQYIWIIENLGDYHDLREHIISDLRTIPVES